jgi:predicted ATPase/class 3 adenylate cyclase
MPATDNEIARLRAAMAALESQRAVLGDGVVEAGLSPLRDSLAALEARRRPEPQRKLVTVLIADLSGFTALSETQDAEDIAAGMNDLWLLVDRVIIEHGGWIDKHVGDAVIALWGATAAREDDPERATRAALAMQAAVAAFFARQNIPLAMRIGVNTGPVLLTSVGTTGEFTAMGDTVNRAGRLERDAPLGSVLISHDTYRHVRGVFDVQSRELPAVKSGQAGPGQTYVVLRAKPRAFRLATRGVEGIETRMIGRDRELGILQDAYVDALESAETRVVTIIGEAGVGKSRLLYEFDNWLELRPEIIRYFKGRAALNTQNAPNSLFRDLFAFRFQILDGDPTAVALDKFRAGVKGILEPERADVAGHWLGFDFAASEAVKPLLGSGDFGAIARAHLTRYFRTLAAKPVVVLLEDIHWADDQSLDLVAYLAATVPTAKLLFVALTRPSLFERRPGWGEGEAAFRQVNLAPLSKRASRTLVDEILQRVEETPDSLRELIVDVAEGNPFYVEELVKMLIDQGVIERIRNYELGIRNEERNSGATSLPPAPLLPSTLAPEEVWHVRTEKLAGLKVPPTLTGLLQTRLDGLTRPEREAIQRAAVVGRIFWDAAVADLIQTPVEELRPTLAAIRKRELIFRREQSSFAGTDEYIFKHNLLRDVAYETVLLKARAELHGRVARWLEDHAGDRLDEYLSVIAEHYVQAGDRLRAAELLEQSGQAAVRVGVMLPGRRALERALALREAASDLEGPADTRAAFALGEACRRLGDYPAAGAALERGLAGARAAGDRAAEAEAQAHLARVETNRGHFDRARTLLEAALPAGRVAGGRTLAAVLTSASNWAAATGDLAAAEALYRETLELARTLGDVSLESLALNGLGAVAADRRDLEEAGRLFQESLALARRVNNPSREATTLLNLGNTAYLRGDYAAAQAYGRAALSSSRELGIQNLSLFALFNLTQADVKLGDLRAAREGAIAALGQARRMGSESWMCWAVFPFGQLLIAEGDLTRGLALFGLARAHPALEGQMRIEIDEELARLTLPPAEIEAGLAAGAALNFDAVIEEILAGQW